MQERRRHDFALAESPFLRSKSTKNSRRMPLVVPMRMIRVNTMRGSRSTGCGDFQNRAKSHQVKSENAPANQWAGNDVSGLQTP
jgi:hypothetical protein